MGGLGIISIISLYQRSNKLAAKDRIYINNEPINFTCRNRRYQTNTSKGFVHGTGTVKGSVLEEPLYSDRESGYSMWLEHVIERSTSKEVYWFMWYDGKGIPTLPLSSVFEKEKRLTIINNIRVKDFP